MKPLRILITNWTLTGRGGSIMYVHDLAMSLFRRGHVPLVYAPDLGEVAHDLRRATIPVVDNLQQITTSPDMIIGNTHPDTLYALLQFPGVPAIFICHAWDTWLADPPKFPRLRRYVAVDETCRDWLVSQRGIPEDRVRIVYNGVDLSRFEPRDPLPEKPQRAAVFGNHLTDAFGLGVLRAACQRAGLSLDVMGAGGGQLVSRPEEILRRYDIVFAKARCAIEAMAVGCAVITCHYGKLGGMVNSQNWPVLRRLNFGRRAIQNKLDVDAVLAEIAKYDARDAHHVSRCIRDVANLEDTVEALLALCREAIIEQTRVGSPGPEAEARAVAEYIRTMDKSRANTEFHQQMTRDNAQIHAERELLRYDNTILQRELATAHGQAATAIEAANARAEAFEHELRAIYESPMGRIVRKLSGLRAMVKRALGLEKKP